MRYNLVGRRRRELGRREADLRVLDVPHVVEALEEGHAVDEVEASTAEGSKVAHNKVDGIGFTADRAVELSVTQSELGLEARAKHTARGQI